MTRWGDILSGARARLVGRWRSDPPGPVLVLGATSAIARCTCRRLAQRGHDLFLAGRNLAALEANAADLRTRYGVRVGVGQLQADRLDNALWEAAAADLGELQGVLLAIGLVGDAETEEIIQTNFTAAVSMLAASAEALRPGGFIIGISSVAGDWGRRRNAAYGAAKAGLTVYLQGLRNELHARGVRVITIKPGFVDTPMTFGRPGMFLVASPDRVAKRIVTALERGDEVVYVPWFWRPVMTAIRHVPEAFLKRLRL